jgi:uncharacterized ferritin-like protein (DUF455 family)
VNTANELRRSALLVLALADVDAKLRAVHELASSNPPGDPDVHLDEPPGLPGRPALPRLVAPGRVPARPISTHEGHAALLHAIAHIELNAVDLALDAIWRFAGMPAAFYGDWLLVADEEATHFELLDARLRGLGFRYGSFDAHTGLWDMAFKTRDDVLARMALVPRRLEARGLDASPAVRGKLASIGDQESAAVIDRILRDEIGHVAIGNRWFHFLCHARDVHPHETEQALAQRYGAPRLRGPFNVAARRAAGFNDAEIAALKT